MNLQVLECRKIIKITMNKLSQINKIVMNLSIEERVKGAIYGSLIGDTVGSTIEFKMTISDEMVNESMKFVGSRNN